MKKKKSNLLSYIIIVVLTLSILASITLAYFTSRYRGESSVSFGTITLKSSIDPQTNSSLRDLNSVVAGQKVLSDDIKVNIANDSEDLVLRANISFSTDDSDENFINWINVNFNSTDYIDSIINKNDSSYIWKKNGNWYYLTNDGNIVTTLSNENKTDDYVFISQNDFFIPTKLKQFQNGDNLTYQYNKSLIIEVSFSSVQRANLIASGEDLTVEKVAEKMK
jgi:hypothetical protein